MQTENPNPDPQLSPESKQTLDFSNLLKITEDIDLKREEDEASDNNGYEEEEEDEDEEEEEFSFMCGGANSSPIAAEDAFSNGQIRPVFPLFSRDLLFSGDGLHENLPMRPPVKKVFVETREDHAPAGETSGEWSDRKAVEASPEICKKSNSTGFSKIWRFKEFLGRSNSDGRDAFVFLNNSHAPPSATPSAAAVAAKGEEKKETAAKGKGKGKKGKTAPLSAHEVYLKSKAKDEVRRRSYLPYRPELMGFFTNVNGGMSKNVHPF